MNLDGISSIKNLEFDIPNRKLTVFHQGEIEAIEKSVVDLNLGGRKISTEQTDQTVFTEHTHQKKLLWSVLAINFAFFQHVQDDILFQYHPYNLLWSSLAVWHVFLFQVGQSFVLFVG